VLVLQQSIALLTRASNTELCRTIFFQLPYISSKNPHFCSVSTQTTCICIHVFAARCYTERGDATVCRPSVRPSVTFRYRDHIAWIISKTRYMFKRTRSLSNASAQIRSIIKFLKVNELKENTLTGIACRVCLVNENEAVKWRDLENPLADARFVP